MIRDLDVEALKATFRNAQPFPFVAIDNFLEPEAALEVARSYPSYAQAARQGDQFKALNEKQKVQIVDAAKFPDPVARLAEALSSEKFRDTLSEISGIQSLRWDNTFAGGGMHLTSRSGRLDVHIDFNRLESSGEYRRLNILVFLNEEWDDAWGGRLELWDQDVKRCHHSFAPVLNRCVVFATSEHSFHGVTQVVCPPGKTRRSFASYYYTKEAPAGAAVAHTTDFRARPNEKLRRYVLMPGAAATGKAKSLAWRVARRAKRAFKERVLESPKG